VRFFNSGTTVDTSYSGFPTHKIKTNFQIWDVTEPEEKKVKFHFYDKDTSYSITPGDTLIPYTENPATPANPKRWPSWQIIFDVPDDSSLSPVTPQQGDILKVTVTKPFRKGDVFEFSTHPEYVDKKLEKSDLDRIAVVPNPYVSTALWEPNPPYSGYQGRYMRKIDFIHLPRKATIRIYTTRGYLVKTIEHNSTMDDGSESWNLISKDGMDIAYGIYIYHIESPAGEKVGKFAIIK
jgi:hypothetical protein